jgi:2-desacetyl-2-hydroxyethyl bacteriochlorophyllide A dehydrogenase
MFKEYMMRAVIWNGPRQMQIEDVPVPKPQQGEVLVKVHSVGICGSELSGFLGESSIRVPPLIMGHEFSGVVTQSGDGAIRFKEGDGVVVNPLITCGECYYCRQGLQNLCRQRQIVGVHTPGAYAEFATVPEANCLPVSNQDHSLLVNSLAEPMACGVRAAKVGGLQPGNTVMILGAGTIGLLSIVAVRQAGGKVALVSETNPGRMATAKAWGAQQVCNPLEDDPVERCQQLTGGLGVDLVIDAVGSTATRQTAIQTVRAGGKVVWVGLHTAESPVPANYIIRSEIQIAGSFAYTPVDFQQAHDILATGEVQLDGTWLQERALDACEVSFVELIDEQPEAAKIVLHP